MRHIHDPSRLVLLGALGAAAWLSGCSAPSSNTSSTSTAAAGAPAQASAEPQGPALPEPVRPQFAAINSAQFDPAAEKDTGGTPAPDAKAGSAGGNATSTSNTAASDTAASNTTGSNTMAGDGESAVAGVAQGSVNPSLFKAQVLLDRANFSTGVIDGVWGSNMRHAIASFAKANGLASQGDLTQDVWKALAQYDREPVAASYQITQEDASGPFYPAAADMVAASKLKHAGYTSAREMLAEKFHMSEEALAALNPGADFGKAGTVILVARPGSLAIPQVDHIEVDKAAAQVRAYDGAGKVLAVMPATVGSADRPSPTGTHKVTGVANDPTYTYDPKKLSWGPKAKGKFVVPSGANNPVGLVWIDLNAPSYGLHGTPDPAEIGKTASHGCVRMTNWDAKLLAASVKPGVEVKFVNSRG